MRACAHQEVGLRRPKEFRRNHWRGVASYSLKKCARFWPRGPQTHPRPSQGRLGPRRYLHPPRGPRRRPEPPMQKPGQARLQPPRRGPRPTHRPPGRGRAKAFLRGERHVATGAFEYTRNGETAQIDDFWCVEAPLSWFEGIVGRLLRAMGLASNVARGEGRLDSRSAPPGASVPGP